MTDTSKEEIEKLAERLNIKSGMIQMGDKIAWGSETALMDEAAVALLALLQERDAERKNALLNAKLAFNHSERFVAAEAQVERLKTVIAKIDRFFADKIDDRVALGCIGIALYEYHAALDIEAAAQDYAT